ncbi:MAG: hypothetical protein AABZ08_03680 [Planctomycetota bacterium]
MAITLTIRDATSSGQTLNELSLDFLTERVTVRELIRSRVYQEVKDFNVNRAQDRLFRGLVKPTDCERELNDTRPKARRDIDWNKQYEVAIDAFRRNGFLILIDDHQSTDLDEEVDLTSKTRVSFLKLVPLVGG